MAVDKLVDSAQLDADLEDVADAIRAKGGTSASLAFPAGFVSAVQAIPTGGGGGATSIKAVTYVVLDNVSRADIYIPFDYACDNYALKYELVESGVYSGGTLVMDSTPTVPLSNNLPLTGVQTELLGHVGYTGYVGSAPQDNVFDMGGSTSVVRGSISTYGRSGDILKESDGTVRLKSQYPFGKTGYYFKYRVTIWGWDNGTELSIATVNVT